MKILYKKKSDEKICKVAMILYTDGLEYDDRVRKEILSIQKNIPYVEFTIFAIVPENQEKSGITDYGIPYYIPFLKSREKFRPGTKTFVKAFDFYWHIKPKLKKYNVIWCADIETFLFPALLPKNKPIIWDLHELPAPFMGNIIMRKVFKYLSSKCTLIYHANKSRIECLRKIGMISSKKNNVAIRNYPQKNLFDERTPPFEKLDEFIKWRQGRKCIYLQGVNSMIRRPIESVSAIIECSGFCGIVVGGFPKEAMKAILDKYSEPVISKKIFFAGRVPQIQTKNFIAECIMGLIFYQTSSLNNIYCEPNRLFQTIMMGKPVIVGCNPPMKEIVEKYKVGKVLNTDGSDISEIVTAISDIDKNYNIYIKNTEKAKKDITWDSQEELLISSFITALNTNNI